MQLPGCLFRCQSGLECCRHRFQLQFSEDCTWRVRPVGRRSLEGKYQPTGRRLVFHARQKTIETVWVSTGRLNKVTIERGPIFIGGPDRCGKTTLQAFLSSHPNIAIPAVGSNFWTYFYG